MADNRYKDAYKKVEDKSSKAIVSEVQRQREEKGVKTKNMGEYREAPGGGTPAKGGGRGAMGGKFYVVDNKEQAEDIKDKEPNAKIRYNQPRTEDGQFTYNSANAKPLYSGKSRGDSTDVPWLAGIDLTFLEKGALFKIRDENISRMISGISMTPDELKQACKVLLDDKKGFAGIVGGMITKKGRIAEKEKTGGGAAYEGKIGKVDTSKLASSTQKDLANAEQKAKSSVPSPIKKRIKTSKIFAADKTPAYSTTGAEAKKPEPTPVKTVEEVKPDYSAPKATEEKKPSLNKETVSKIKEIFAGDEELKDITEEDIIEMYENGTLTEDDLKELGVFEQDEAFKLLNVLD